MKVILFAMRGGLFQESTDVIVASNLWCMGAENGGKLPQT